MRCCKVEAEQRVAAYRPLQGIPSKYYQHKANLIALVESGETEYYTVSALSGLDCAELGTARTPFMTAT